mgnify:CR=1 FL=1|jgi:hypothetical protein
MTYKQRLVLDSFKGIQYTINVQRLVLFYIRVETAATNQEDDELVHGGPLRHLIFSCLLICLHPVFDQRQEGDIGRVESV